MWVPSVGHEVRCSYAESFLGEVRKTQREKAMLRHLETRKDGVLTQGQPGESLRGDGMTGAVRSVTAPGPRLPASCHWGAVFIHPGYLDGLRFQKLLREAGVSHPGKVLSESKSHPRGAPRVPVSSPGFTDALSPRRAKGVCPGPLALTCPCVLFPR